MNEELEADLFDEMRPITTTTGKKLYSNHHVVGLKAILFSYVEVILLRGRGGRFGVLPFLL